MTEPYEAKVIADSISVEGVRLTTFEVCHPRFILAEINTHRMLSRSSASSRAIPVETRIRMIMERPYVPEVLGKNKKGMQAGDSLEEAHQIEAQLIWLQARDKACRMAAEMASLGVHKQWANRLIEPFAWNTAIISGTEWDNFFALRTHTDAQPEFRKTALAMRAARAASAPKRLKYGQWHLPYIDERDADEPLEQKIKLSCARSARVSYLTHDGRRDTEADLVLYERLQTAGHMSPFEHAATPAPKGRGSEFFGNFKGWVQHRKQIPGEAVFRG